MRRRTTAALVLTLFAAAGCTSSTTHVTASGPLSGTAGPPASASGSGAPTSTAPLSDFESYPVVEGLRRWTYAAGRAINTGHDTSVALDALMTARAKADIGQVLGRYVGGYFPGPVPFQPTGVAALDGSHMNIYGCAQVDGWAENTSTHKPLRPRKVSGARYVLVRTGGPWLVDAFELNPRISCSDVKVKAPTW